MLSAEGAQFAEQKEKYNPTPPGDVSFYMPFIPPQRSAQGLNHPTAPCCLLHRPPAAPSLGSDALFHLLPAQTANTRQRAPVFITIAQRNAMDNILPLKDGLIDLGNIYNA